MCMLVWTTHNRNANKAKRGNGGGARSQNDDDEDDDDDDGGDGGGGGSGSGCRDGDYDEMYTRCFFFFLFSKQDPIFGVYTLCYYLNAAFGHRLLATLDPLWHPRRFLLGESLLLAPDAIRIVSACVYVCLCRSVYWCARMCMFSIKVI